MLQDFKPLPPPVSATHDTREHEPAAGVCERQERGLSGSQPHHLVSQAPQSTSSLQPRERRAPTWVCVTSFCT